MSISKTFLVSHWKLDSTADSFGSNTLTNVNSTGFVTGKIGNGSDFEDLIPNYFSVADNASLRCGTGIFGFCGWFKPEHLTPMVIVGKDSDSPANSRDYTVLADITTLRFHINGGGTSIVNHPDTLVVDTWYFFAAWHTPGSQLLNLQLNNGTVYTAATGGELPTQSTAEFRIGARAYSGAEGYFDGIVDELSYFKGGFPDSTERTELYNSGGGITFEAWDGGANAVPVFMNQYRQRRA